MNLADHIFMEVCCGPTPNISMEVRNLIRNTLMDPVYVGCSHPGYPEEGPHESVRSNRTLSEFLEREFNKTVHDLYFATTPNVWLDAYWGISDTVENHIGVLDVSV
jgi:phenylpropionate dioxygenase-like ring-hydroxylating dioxygenase large terminal subunit